MNEYSYSGNMIFECSYLFSGWEIGHPLSTCATGGMEGEGGLGHPKYVQMRTEIGGWKIGHKIDTY